jgi:hypothetical protein
MSKKSIVEAEIVPDAPLKKRAGDGGIYAVVADETREFDVSLRHAARRAAVNRGHVGIIHVLQLDGFVHWGKVEKKMRDELRVEAEKFLWKAAKTVYDLNGMMPGFYLYEGNRMDRIVDAINEYRIIRALVLGAGEGTVASGSLVSYFSGKGLNRLRVPMIVVPSHLPEEEIDALSRDRAIQ